MQDWLSNWENLGPMIAIVVSLLGFSVAIWQIRRTSGAIEAARRAMDSTRDAFIKNQVQENLVRTIGRAQEIRGLYSESNWDRALYSYPDVWITLSYVASHYPNLGEEQRSSVNELIGQLQANERLLEKAVLSGKSPVKPQEHVKVLQSLQVTLSDLSANLH